MSNAHASTPLAIIAATLLVAAQACFAGPASAEKYNVVPLKTMSPDDLKKKCDKAGGNFENYGGQDWTCQTKDGVVACNSKQCTGVTTNKSSAAPKQLADPKTVFGTFSEQ